MKFAHFRRVQCYNLCMTLQDIIRNYKNKTGKTDTEIAEYVGVSHSTVCRWSTGAIKRISGDTMKKVSEMVGYDIEPAIKGMDVHIKLPVLGYVKGGYDLYAEENYLGEEEASIEEASRANYWLKVTGNSMNGAGILDGSLVLVRQCEKVESGKIAVVLVGDEVTVKRVIYQPKMLVLESANPEVPSRYFTSSEVKDTPVRILGQVISCKTYF